MVDALLLSLSAAAVFRLMKWRAQKLPPAQQTILRNEVLVSRGSLKEPKPDIEADVERIFQERLKKSAVSDLDRQLLRKQTEEQIKWQYQLVPPNMARSGTLTWACTKPFAKPTPFLRIKLHTPESALNLMQQRSVTYLGDCGLVLRNHPNSRTNR
jgi:hypothetical protein